MRNTPQRPVAAISSSTSLNTNLKRRRFLLALSAGTAGSAAAAAQVIASPILADEAAPAAQSRGYRETEHVRTYYNTTRL